MWPPDETSAELYQGISSVKPPFFLTIGLQAWFESGWFRVSGVYSCPLSAGFAEVRVRGFFGAATQLESGRPSRHLALANFSNLLRNADAVNVVVRTAK